jgi:calcineurin-like phosphoesterase family protein
MLHGHSHGNLIDLQIPRVDVGIDMHPNNEPFSFSEIEQLMSDRVYKASEEHNNNAKML